MNATIAVQLDSVACFKCGVRWWIEADLKERWLREREKTTFFCPNGHSQHFVGKTFDEQLSEAKNEAARERAARDQAEAALATAKRKLQRMKKGLCPLCDKGFARLASHMKRAHPEWKP